MRIAKIDRKLFISLAALVIMAFAASAAQAQFTPPTCTPPNCSPTVIQNIAISSPAQTASINVTGDAKIGASFQAGALAPVLNAAGQNLYYGNVGATSSAGSLILLQNGGFDRFRVDLAGNETVAGVRYGPLGTVGAPSYTVTGDTNTGFYSPVADQMAVTTGGTQRMVWSAAGSTVSSGQLTVPVGTVAAPSITFAGDSNTGIYHNGADTLNFVTNGVNVMTVSSTGTTVVAGNLVVYGTVTAPPNPNAALLNATQTFTGTNTFSSGWNSFTGSGAGLTSLNASNLSSGTVPSARISGTYSNALTLSGNNTYSGMSSFGSAALVLGLGQNLIYGNVDTTSSGNLLLLQNESVDRFRVDAAGNVIAAGGFTGTTGTFSGNVTVAGQSVCRADGTNCPASSGVTGSGLINYVAKFTPSGTAIGSSLIQDNGTFTSVGGSPTNGDKLHVYGDTRVDGQVISTGNVDRPAVYAQMTNTTGSQPAVYGGAAGAGFGYGVYGEYTGTNAGGYGLYGRSTASAGTGIYATATGASGYGGYFYTPSGSTALVAWAAAAPFSAIQAIGNVAVSGNTQLGDGTVDTTTVNGSLTLALGGAVDPAGVNGRMYLNTGTNRLRCYDAGAWKDCIGGVSGSGTINRIPKFTAASTLGNSLLTDNGTTVTNSGNLAMTTGYLTLGQAAVDPATTVGGTYYFNTSSGRVRCYSAGSWQNCGPDDGLDEVTRRGSFAAVPLSFTATGYANAVMSVTANTVAGVYIQSAGAGSGNGLQIVGSGLSNGVNVSTDGTAGRFVNTLGGQALYASGSAQIDGTLTLPPGTARLGVGTGSPSYPLHVVGNAYVTTGIGVGASPVGGYGINISASTYGLYAASSGTGVRAQGTNYGIYGVSTSAVGGYFTNLSTGTIGGAGYYDYGLFASAESSSNANNYGVVSYARLGTTSNNAGYFYASGADPWGITIASGGARKPGGGSFTIYSDARTKKDVTNFKDGLETLKKLRPVNYTYNGLGGTPEGMKSIGFIAQEVKEVAPYLVSVTHLKLRPTDAKETDMYMVDPSALTYMSINAIKEIDMTVQAQQEEIETLRRELEELKQRLQ